MGICLSTTGTAKTMSMNCNRGTKNWATRKFLLPLRIVILVALASLGSPRWTSLTTTAVFRLPRGTLFVRGATTLVQLTAASWVLTCTSVRTGLRAIHSLSLSRPCHHDDGFSDVMAAYGAVLCFVELHCDVPVSPGDCGAWSRVHEVLRHSSWFDVPVVLQRQVTRLRV